MILKFTFTCPFGNCHLWADLPAAPDWIRGECWNTVACWGDYRTASLSSRSQPGASWAHYCTFHGFRYCKCWSCLSIQQAASGENASQLGVFHHAWSKWIAAVMAAMAQMAWPKGSMVIAPASYTSFASSTRIPTAWWTFPVGAIAMQAYTLRMQQSSPVARSTMLAELGFAATLFGRIRSLVQACGKPYRSLNWTDTVAHQMDHFGTHVCADCFPGSQRKFSFG